MGFLPKTHQVSWSAKNSPMFYKPLKVRESFHARQVYFFTFVSLTRHRSAQYQSGQHPVIMGSPSLGSTCTVLHIKLCNSGKLGFLWIEMV